MPVLVHDCPHCAATNVALNALLVIPREDYSATAYFECQICRKPIGAWLNANHWNTSKPFSVMAKHGGSFNSVGWSAVGIWPQRRTTEAPKNVPEAIVRNFIQAEHAAVAGHRESAGMTFRRVLELTMKDLFPVGKGTLAKRIDAYAAQGGLTDAMKEWADTVREIGNETAHDTTEPSQEDIDDLAAFTRVMLEYLYTMPAKVAARNPTPQPGAAPP